MRAVRALKAAAAAWRLRTSKESKLNEQIKNDLNKILDLKNTIEILLSVRHERYGECNNGNVHCR